MTDTSLSQTLIIGHLWQSVAIAAVLAVALIFGKRMRGSTRYGLGLAAFVASLALPLAAFIPGETIVASLLKQLNAPVSLQSAAPTVEVATVPISDIAAPAAQADPFLRAVTLGENVAAPAVAAVPEMAVSPALTAPVRAAAPVTEPSALVTLPAIPLPDIVIPLLLVWLGVAAFLIARTVRDLLAVERLVARARPADLPPALKSRMRGVRVVVSPDAPGPMAAGLLHPAIVLPESIALASPGMAALLEHEHAHIRRNDMLAALGQRIVLALLWWSPALYWISRRMDEEREVACDEAAVDRTGDARAFARSLTKQAENQLWVRAPRLAVGAIGPRSQFSRRIRRLIDLAKTGGSPAKYSGRVAFAGLALAIGVAALVTPRFIAEAQQPSSGAIDITKPDAPARASADDRRSLTLDGAGPNDDFDFQFDWNDQDFAGLGAELQALFAELDPQLQALGAELGPEMQAELAGLSTELAAMGIDISAAISHDVMAQLPDIMDQVRTSLEAAGLDPNNADGWNQLSEEEREEVRAALQEAREELKHAFGPEMKAEIRAAMEEARAELAEHRDEIAAALSESHAGLAIAREAIAAAREELAAARERGDFKAMGAHGISFDFGPEVLEGLRQAGLALDGAGGATFGHFGNGTAHRLIEAADDCELADLNRLVTDEKADVNSLIPGMGTALMAAVDASCDEAARVLINAGADVNRGFPGQGTPLTIAVDEEDLAMVQLLLSRGADANATMPGADAPLMIAVDAGNHALVKALVEKGADVNRRTPMSGMRNALDVAIDEDETAIADYLRSKGATASRRQH